MPSFEYQALDGQGKSHKGFIQADNEAQARQLIRDQQLAPLSLKSAHQQALQVWKKRVSIASLGVFIRQFASLIEAGVPITEALGAVAIETPNRSLRHAIEQVKSSVSEGQPLQQAFAAHPNYFPTVFCTLIAAGERSGNLTGVLLQLADYAEKQQQLRSSLREALIYPAILSLVGLVVTTLLVVYILPKIANQLLNHHSELPWLTSMMLNTSEWLQQYGLIAFGLMLLSLFAFRHFAQHPSFSSQLQQLLLRVPIAGKLSRKIASTRLLTALSTLVSGGVPLLEAMLTAAPVMASKPLELQLQKAIEQVQNGRSLHQSLAETELLPATTLSIVSTGEKSGNLASALNRSAAQQSEQLHQLMRITAKAAEPALIVIFGIIVALVVLSILLPILQLNNLTQF